MVCLVVFIIAVKAPADKYKLRGHPLERPPAVRYLAPRLNFRLVFCCSRSCVPSVLRPPRPSLLPPGRKPALLAQSWQVSPTWPCSPSSLPASVRTGWRCPPVPGHSPPATAHTSLSIQHRPGIYSKMRRGIRSDTPPFTAYSIFSIEMINPNTLPTWIM